MSPPTPSETSAHGPIRVVVLNDYPLVVAGVWTLLGPWRERVTRVRLQDGPQVVLYDAFGRLRGDSLRVEQVLAGVPRARLLVYSWNQEPAVVRAALAAGADGYVFKGLPADRLVAALEAAARGEAPVTELSATRTRPPEGTDWPGRAEGLSVREAEIIALITQGHTNQDIAERSHLSINSIKTYIRTAYRKMGVERRPQAVLWGVRHGFETFGSGPQEDAADTAASS